MARNKPFNLDDPIAYFITFHTYGTWLHASEKGSVDRERNKYGEALIRPNAEFEKKRRDSMRQSEMIFDDAQRLLLVGVVREVCLHRGWMLRAVNVRTNHVHAVVSGGASPESMLADFKRYSTRRLRERGLIGLDRLVWAEHGSTRYLWNEQSVCNACDYVANRQ
jgi:REP element-mobilizing transposase RayT